MVCHITGFQGIQSAYREKLDIKPGQTTFDGRFTLLPTLLPWQLRQGPTMMIDDDTHSYLTPEAIPDLWSGINENHYSYCRNASINLASAR